MRSTPIALTVATLLAVACAACSDTASPTGATPPGLHVGYKGPDEPLGFVTNDAECHVGKKGNRWPAAEQYDVKTYDAHLVVTESGNITLVCQGDIPANQPVPDHAEVEQAVLCFLPNQLETRQAQEVFTPSGKIVLECHLN